MLFLSVRFLYDLKIKCFCPADELIPANDPREPGRVYARSVYDVLVLVFTISK